MSESKKVDRRKFIIVGVATAAVAAAGVGVWRLGGLRSVERQKEPEPTATTLQPLSIGVTSAAPTLGPLLVAEQKGFFRQAGLDAAIKRIEGGTLRTNALIAGEIEVTVGGFTEVAKTVAKGQALIWIYTLQNRNDWAIMVRSDVAAKAGVTINSPLQERFNAMKGLLYGSLPAGGDVDTATRYVAISGGLDPERDIKFVYMSGIPLIRAAFKEGKIQAYGLTRSNSFDFLRDGTGIDLLANTPTRSDLPEFRDIVNYGVYVMRQTMENKPDLLKRLARAMYMASQFIEDNPKEYGEILVKANLVESGGMEEAVASLVWMNDRTGYSSVEGIRNNLEVRRIGGYLTQQEYDSLISNVNVLYTNQFLPNPNPPQRK